MRGASNIDGLVRVMLPLEKGTRMLGLTAPIVKPGPPGKPDMTCSISGQSAGKEERAVLVAWVKLERREEGSFSNPK